VVCIDGAHDVQDVAVLRFTRALYMSLACGQSVYTAFYVAKQSVASQPDIMVRVLVGVCALATFCARRCVRFGACS
jgi:hypothetical protein